MTKQVNKQNMHSFLKLTWAPKLTWRLKMNILVIAILMF